MNLFSADPDRLAAFEAGVLIEQSNPAHFFVVVVPSFSVKQRRRETQQGYLGVIRKL